MDLFQIEEVLCDSCPQESKDKTGTLTFSRLKEILSPENTYETLFFSLRKAINIHSVVKCNSVECIFVSWGKLALFRATENKDGSFRMIKSTR